MSEDMVIGPRPSLSTPLALSSSLRAFVGVGVLSLPAALKSGGILPFLVLLVFFTYVALYCILKLVECSNIIQFNEAKLNMYRRKLREYKANKKQAALLNTSPLHHTTSLGSSSGNVPISPSSVHIDFNSLQEEDICLFDDYPQLLKPAADSLIVASNSYDIIPAEHITDEDRATVTVPTFREIGSCALSRTGAYLTDFGVLGTQCSTTIAYTIFISNSLHEVFPQFSRFFWVAMIYLPLLYVGQIRDVAKLAPVVTIGNVVYITTIVVFLYTGFTQFCCKENNFFELNMFDHTHITTIFGTLAFALAGNSMILPLQAAMRNKAEFPKMITTAMMLVGGIYFVIGLAGYYFFGAETHGSVLSNLTYGFTSNIVKIMLSACLFFSYPLQHFPNTQLYDSVIDNYMYTPKKEELQQQQQQVLQEQQQQQQQQQQYQQQPSPTTNHQERLQQIAHDQGVLDAQRESYQTWARVASVTFSTIIALLFPDVGLIIALFGSLSNSLLAYILPVIFYVNICQFSILNKQDYYPFDRQGNPNPSPITLETIYHINLQQLNDNAKDNKQQLTRHQRTGSMGAFPGLNHYQGTTTTLQGLGLEGYGSLLGDDEDDDDNGELDVEDESGLTIANKYNNSNNNKPQFMSHHSRAAANNKTFANLKNAPSPKETDLLLPTVSPRLLPGSYNPATALPLVTIQENAANKSPSQRSVVATPPGGSSPAHGSIPHNNSGNTSTQRVDHLVKFRTTEPQLRAPADQIFNLRAFPYFVTILGLIASVIGVTVATQDLIRVYW